MQMTDPGPLGCLVVSLLSPQSQLYFLSLMLTLFSACLVCLLITDARKARAQADRQTERQTTDKTLSLSLSLSDHSQETERDKETQKNRETETTKPQTDKTD